MVNYICETCNKVFLQKGHFNDHKNKRKYPCKPNEVQINNEILKNPQIILKNPHNENKKNYVCNFCGYLSFRIDTNKNNISFDILFFKSSNKIIL